MSNTHPNISPRAVKLLKYLEGLRLQAYLDTAGVWTIGYGHTGGVREGQRITPAQADAILHQDLDRYEQGVYDACNGLPQDPFDAAVLLAFNIGVAAFRGSTACRLLQKRDYEGAAKAMQLWNKSMYNGRLVVDKILTRRREIEARVMLGDFPSELIK